MEICQIYLVYAIYGCKNSSENKLIHWRRVGHNYFHEILHSEKTVPCNKLQGKIAFRKNYSTLDHSLFLESDKLRSWRACVLTCFACLRAWMLTCLVCFNAYVLACLRTSMLGVLACLTCFHARVLGLLLYSRALRAYVLAVMKYFTFLPVYMLGMLSISILTFCLFILFV